MDIDFHYYATYLAACLAGYDSKRALTIATSAQMIDENSRHVLVKDKVGMTTGLRHIPDDFELRRGIDGPVVHIYRVQRTFQGVGDSGTDSRDGVCTTWPVFHFLPGNFKITNIGTAARSWQSERWFQRSLKASYASDKDVTENFEWLCRPHSPMAISMIENCREIVNATPNSNTSNEIVKHGLKDYFIGVTMHVFVDTWAHQDFVGVGIPKINSIKEFDHEVNGVISKTNLLYTFIDPPRDIQDLPTVKGKEIPVSPNPEQWEVDYFSYYDKGSAPSSLTWIRNNLAIGHAIVGHLPDHSSLVWKYKPRWSDTTIVRNNPHQYYDAFVHLILSLKAILNNQPYKPIDITSESIREHLGNDIETKLLKVYKLLALKRHAFPKVKDPLREVNENYESLDNWDGMIWVHGDKWIQLIKEMGFEEIKKFEPGKSDWVTKALDTYNKNNEGNRLNSNWYTVDQFQTLEFFKFNVAAKFHYRFVKEQLMNFNKKLLGDWEDGAAYADDFTFLRIDNRIISTQTNKTLLLDILTKLHDLQRTEANREVNTGLTVLIKDIEASLSIDAANSILTNLIKSVKNKESWTYGLLDDKGNVLSSKAIRVIEGIVTTHIKWQADNEVIQCPCCKKEFGFFTRRHHCRICGRVFCDECTPTNEDGIRVCLMCVPTGNFKKIMSKSIFW